MFSKFPEQVISNMETESYAYHAHDHVVAVETYDSSEALGNFFKILATDTNEGLEFVMAVEARNYPIAGVMFHPETQNIRIFGGGTKATNGKVNNMDTSDINYWFSEFLFS